MKTAQAASPQRPGNMRFMAKKKIPVLLPGSLFWLPGPANSARVGRGQFKGYRGISPDPRDGGLTFPGIRGGGGGRGWRWGEVRDGGWRELRLRNVLARTAPATRPQPPTGWLAGRGTRRDDQGPLSSAVYRPVVLRNARRKKSSAEKTSAEKNNMTVRGRARGLCTPSAFSCERVEPAFCCQPCGLARIGSSCAAGRGLPPWVQPLAPRSVCTSGSRRFPPPHSAERCRLTPAEDRDAGGGGSRRGADRPRYALASD